MPSAGKLLRNIRMQGSAGYTFAVDPVNLYYTCLPEQGQEGARFLFVWQRAGAA